MLQKAGTLSYRTMTVRRNRACIWFFFLIVAVQKENSPKPTFGMKSVFLCNACRVLTTTTKATKRKKAQENGLQTQVGSTQLSSHAMQSEWRDATG